MTIWIDVEDLYEYARENARPRGIPRLSFELYGELVSARGEAEIRFCRHAKSGDTLYEVAWADVRALYAGMGADQGPRCPSAPVVVSSAGGAEGGLRAKAQRVAERLPSHVRTPLVQSAKHFTDGFRFGVKALKAMAQRGTTPPRVAVVDGGGAVDIRRVAKPGDVLLVFGAHWVLPNYGKLIADLKAATGLKVGLLIYDVIPVLHPEWCGRFMVKLFSGWLAAMIPISDMLFAISKATADDTTAWARRMKLPLAGPVTPIPIGTGFSGAPPSASPSVLSAPLPAGLTPGGFALFVSTIEARKNHLAAFRIWRRLLAANPPQKVPVLVFAGRVGWLADDLMLQIANADNLDGKLLVIGELDDATLAALYQGCRFTLFPSLYEGWGLPVTESLGYGKVCLASDRASIPEAGGDFCAYYDPDDLTAATAVFQRALDEPEWIAGLEVRIKAEFHPVGWSETAAAVLRGVEAGSEPVEGWANSPASFVSGPSTGSG